MKSNEPMEKSDRRFAWAALGVWVLGLSTFALMQHSPQISIPSPILIVLFPLTWFLAPAAFIVACLEDLSKREFRDRNSKMRWTNAFWCFSPAFLIYLLYFGFILVRRERSNRTRRQRTNST